MIERHFNPSQIPSTSRRKSCKQYGMICHRTPSTRPYWALSKYFKFVWKLGADTLNTSWNKLFLQGFEMLSICDSLKCQISMFSFDFNTSTLTKIVIICPMRQQHWTDYKISLCVCEWVCEWVSQCVSEFWDPLDISGNVEARNFKFGTQIGHWGT